MRKSRVHGVVRRWDSPGNLVDESEFSDGTGVLRTWSDSGLLETESFLKEGIPHGRMCAWDEDGELLVEQYSIAGKKVSKKQYFQTCETDPTLPIYSNEGRDRCTNG